MGFRRLKLISKLTSIDAPNDVKRDLIVLPARLGGLGITCHLKTYSGKESGIFLCRLRSSYWMLNQKLKEIKVLSQLFK